MPSGNSSIISVIGSSYFQPIADLVEKWILRKPPIGNSLQSGYYEQGYAASIILLLVAMFESYITRLRYLNRGNIPSGKKHALDILKAIIPGLPNAEKLWEVYDVRDSLIHNHLWEIEYEWDDSNPLTLTRTQLDSDSGNNRFRRTVNLDTMRTRMLNLNVRPTSVDREDVIKVFDTIWETLLRFEKTDFNLCCVSNEVVVLFGKQKLFSEIRDTIHNQL